MVEMEGCVKCFGGGVGCCEDIGIGATFLKVDSLGLSKTIEGGTLVPGGRDDIGMVVVP